MQRASLTLLIIFVANKKIYHRLSLKKFCLEKTYGTVNSYHKVPLVKFFVNVSETPAIP